VLNSVFFQRGKGCESGGQSPGHQQHALGIGMDMGVALVWNQAFSMWCSSLRSAL
jgi:hypothetical protein